MTALMSAHMEAVVRQRAQRFYEEGRVELDRLLVKKQAQPMTTFSKTTKFEVTTPQDGPREFVLVMSLTEQASPDGTPDTNEGRTTR